MVERRIKQEARRLGFELVGITTPDPPPHYDIFETWLQAGRHGQMAYLASERSRQRRADPRLILPECQSILVLGIRYGSQQRLKVCQFAGNNEDSQAKVGDGQISEQNASLDHPFNLRGRVASYAWGKDYHDVLPVRLQALVDFIETQAGHPVPNRYYTDTGPILERDLAQRAGLGWIGKNTCLINPQAGSFFLLAEILLGLALAPDQPFTTDRCGSCRRCLEVCPTQCILPDRTIDASRCISYLSIELKGPIPTQLRPTMGNWVFGCDLCQQVCPWNIRLASLPDGSPDPTAGVFSPRPELAFPTLIHELSLTPEQFNRKFKGSPIKRTKRRGYLRNVAVALGNGGDPAAIPALSLALIEDLEPLVRGHSAWALGQIGGSEAHQILTHAKRVESDTTVQAEIRAAISKITNG